MNWINVEPDGTVRIFIDESNIKCSMEELSKGRVIDASEGKSCLLRAWKQGDEIHVAYQFGHDVAWPHDVYIFPFINEGKANPLKCIPLHEYLATGNGIPPADSKKAITKEGGVKKDECDAYLH